MNDSKLLEQMQDDLDQIKRAVIGESKTGQVGLVKRVERIERWKTGLTLKIAAYAGLGTGIALTVKFLMEHAK